LLRAAVKVMGRKGLNAATIEEITEAAGVTPGALYKHFGSKEDLFMGILEEHLDTRFAQWQVSERGATTDEQHLAAILGSAQGTRAPLQRAVLEFLVQLHSKPSFRSRFMAIQRRTDAQAAQLLTETCNSLGITFSIPVEQLVYLVDALSAGLQIRKSVDPKFDFDSHLSVGLAALLAGVSDPAEASTPVHAKR
jgi:AcrR family transcriptional regulator